jgi:signal transduction histidine kinase/ligand-binding sensor domain-containing protein
MVEKAPMSRPGFHCRQPRADHGPLECYRRLVELSFLMAALCSCASAAQEKPIPLRLTQLDHKVWTVRDGAPAPILGIAQDRDGTLWLSGTRGLYRFNGLSFSQFHAPSGTADLPAGAYGSILVAKNGDVWVGSMLHGIARIRQGRVSFFDEHQGFPSLTVEAISEALDGSIWAAVHGQLVVFDGNRWTDAGALSGISNEGGVRTVFFDHRGTQWVATAQSIYYRPLRQQKFVRAIQPGPETDVSNFTESRSGELWIAILRGNPSRSDLVQLDPASHRVDDSSVIHLSSFVWHIAFNSDNSLWVTGSELIRLIPVMTGAKRTFSRETFGIADGLASPKTEAILEDRNGDIWLSSPRGIERFQDPVLIKYVDGSLPDPMNIALARDAQGTIWIGNEGTPLLSVHEGSTEEHGPPLARVITTLFADSRGTIWIETSDGIVRETDNRLTHVELPKGIPPWAPRQFFETRPGEINVSIGTHGVIRLVDGKWLSLALPNQPSDAPLDYSVDKQGRIWIGYVGGEIGMVDHAAGRVFAVGTGSDLGSVDTFLDTSEGFLCGGTNGIAILRGDRFEVLPASDQTTMTGISGMVQAKNGDLWLNGVHGVARISYSDYRSSVSRGVPMPTELFTQTEITGPAQSFGFPTAVSDAEGRIWFNTSGVIAYVDPAHIPHNTLPPNLSVSSVEEDGQRVGEENRVKAGSNTVRIPYFGANLFAPEKVRYSYWLHGIDRTWQDVGRRTEAVYTHPGPGKYLFEVKATNGSGVWSVPVSTSFTVEPLFYQTWWFQTLCLALTAVVIWFGLVMRVRYIAAQIQLRAEERTNERIRIAREFHDTLLQGIQGLLLSFHAAAAKVPADTDSKKALEKALASADRMILEGRDRIHRLRSQELRSVELRPAIEAVADELGSLSQSKFFLEQEGTSRSLRPEVIDEIFYIVREALTNSFRHSAASRIIVRLDYGKDRFTLTCHDDGLGYSPGDLAESEEQGHFGLRGMAERADKIGAAFDHQSARGEGTRIRVVLPARRAYSRNAGFRLPLWPRNSA